MQVTATLNNLRMAPRKVRLVADLVKGRGVESAKTELSFMPKKAANIILKLLNSALANAKHDFNIEENNLYILKLIVDAGPSLKRWMPRAMGRATPILKRTSSISLVLAEKSNIAAENAAFIKESEVGKAKGIKEEKRPGLAEAGKEEMISSVPEERAQKTKPAFPVKPYGAQEQGKKRFFSRQTFGGIKKAFRRKAI